MTRDLDPTYADPCLPLGHWHCLTKKIIMCTESIAIRATYQFIITRQYVIPFIRDHSRAGMDTIFLEKSFIFAIFLSETIFGLCTFLKKVRFLNSIFWFLIQILSIPAQEYILQVGESFQNKFNSFKVETRRWIFVDQYWLWCEYESNHSKIR